MAETPKNPDPVTEPAPKPAPAPAAASFGEAEIVGHLYKGSRVSGKLYFQGAARIDGAVDGEVECSETLTIGEGAEVRAKILSRIVVIRGKVEGNITAKEKIELIAPARISGNIITPRLTVTDGVLMDGDVSMGMARQKGGVAGSQSASVDKGGMAQKPSQQVESHK